MNTLGGGVFASRACISAFSSLYKDCTLIYPDNGKDIQNSVKSGIKLIPCSDSRSSVRKCFDIYRGKLHRFESFVKKHLQSHKVDIIVFDHGVVSTGLLHFVRAQHCKVIAVHHNVEFQYLKDNKPNVWIRKPYIYYMQKAERELIQNAELNLTMTDEDANLFCKLYDGNSDNVVYWGTFEPYGTKRFKDIKVSTNAVKRFVISGSLSFPQTENSIISFLQIYYPILCECLSDFQLIITGRNPSNRLIRFCEKYQFVEIRPNPDNILEIVASCDVFLSPIDLGGGVKLRNMDGLKLGLPLLAHKNSSRGYEALLQDNLMYSYSTVDEFRKALLCIINTTWNKEVVIEKYYSRFSFDAGVLRLKNILSNKKMLL